MKWFCATSTILVLLQLLLNWTTVASTECPRKSDFPIEICQEMLKPNSQYRPVNGRITNRCKNTGQPLQPYDRILNPHYADCQWSRRLTKNSNVELPLERTISLNVLRPFRRQLKNVRSPNFLITMLGQYIAHDIGSTRALPNGANCCSADWSSLVPLQNRSADCAQFVVQLNDPDFRVFDPITCYPVIRRSEYVETDSQQKKWPREQLNEVTAFVDHSNLYGNSEEVLQSLRANSGGRMITNSANIMPEGNGIFRLGDGRLNQTPQLAVIHSIYLREHNRIADILKELNPRWNDERIFQEARRINIAQYQHVVYKEFLPTFLAPSVVKYLEDPVFAVRVEAVTFNEFNHAVFRMFHGFIPTEMQIIAANGSVTMKTIHEMTTTKPFDYLPSYYDDVVRGLVMQGINMETYDPNMMRDLFNPPGRPGGDLASLDILRGRDHGLPPYVEVLKLVNKMGTFKRFEDLSPYMSAENIKLLRENYEAVEDVDLLVGAWLENPMEGTLLGATPQMVFVKQFLRLKAADPYFYTNSMAPKPFTAKQLKEIKKATTNQLICLNTGVITVPKVSAVAPNSERDVVKCDSLEKISYNSWKE